MKPNNYFLLQLLQLLFSSHYAESVAPTITAAPDPTVTVVEGTSITLEWTYDLNGVPFVLMQLLPQGQSFVVQKILTNPPAIRSAYNGRITVNITEDYALITFLAVNETTDSRRYDFTVQNNDGATTKSFALFVQVPPYNIVTSGNKTVNTSEQVTLECTALGNPGPNITWRRVSNNSVVTMPLTITGEQDGGSYRCTADNGVGNPITKDVFISVQYPPTIVHISGNLSVNDRETVRLNCTPDSNPRSTTTWTRLSDGKIVTMPLTITGKQDQGGYRCTASNGIGNPAKTDVFITVQNYRPTDTNLTTNLTDNAVVWNEPFNLMCRADANPPAHYRLYKEQQPLTTITDNQAVGTFTTTAGERIKQVTYSCTPNNSFGVGPSDTAVVTVHFSPSATSSGRNGTVRLGTPVSFTCPVDGNPPPSVRWYKGNEPSGTVLSSEKEFEFIPNSLSDTGLYTCFANNYLGNISVSFGIKVVAVTPSSSATPAKPVSDVQVECRVTNKNCRVPGDVEQVNQEFPKEVYDQTKKRLPQLESVNGSVTGCGSVIVNLVLRFNQSVSENEVILILKDGARRRSFGQFTMDPDSVKLANTGREPTKGLPPCKKSFFQNDDCSDNLLHLILIIVAAVVLIVIIAAAVGFWIHKKRKCRKDTRIAHDPGSEEQKLQGGDPYAHGNNGYAESGPPSVNGAKKAAAAVPDYAVVDKSAKKKRKEDREKSSEKKNKNVDDTYAKVDMSKKSSKKKPRPGEDMLYADLGDFSGASQMPTVATSPKAQFPPIKRPEPYEGTQYADITQFLKGDGTLPEDDKQGTELKEKDEKTDGAGVENVPKETPMQVEQF